MIRLFLFFFAVVFCPFYAHAADSFYPEPWPFSEVTVTAPSIPGSESDALFSLAAKPFAEQTGKKFAIKHVPGQAGATAWARVVDDVPNGSALTAVTLPEFFLRALQPDSGVVPAHMSICNIIAYTPCVLWAPAEGPLADLDAFLDEAAAKNGSVIVAGPGRYSAGQLANRILNRQAGIRTIYFPYAGSLEAGKAVADQKASVFWAHSMPVAARGTSFKALAVAAEKRLPSLPDAPTFRELGLDVVMGVYYAAAVPFDTPEMTQDEISEFFSQLAATAAFRKKASALGFLPLNVPKDDVPVFVSRYQKTLQQQIEDYAMTLQ